MTIISNTQKVKIRRIVFQGQPEQKLMETSFQPTSIVVPPVLEA
jgi:hypothetical protein